MRHSTNTTYRNYRAMMAILALTVFLSATWLTGIRAQTSEPATPASELVPELLTATPTLTPAPEPSPTPTVMPSPEPSPTVVPTATPTVTPTSAPSPTVVPTATPTVTPTSPPSPTVALTATPTMTPASEPSPTATDVATKPPTVTNLATPSAIGTATAEPGVTLQVHASNTNFGQVSANGDVDPTVRGLTSTVDEGGAFYVRTGAIELAVTAGDPWNGSCTTDPAGTGRLIGGLEWRLTGTTTWAPFPTSSAGALASSNCFPQGTAGMHTFTYDLRLRVEQGDLPGRFAATIVFDVEG